MDENKTVHENFAQSFAAEKGDNLNSLESVIVPIGITEDKTVLSQDLNAVPHILVCGYTGAGKTSFVQTILTNMIQQYTPADIRFIIYDSKMVDYSIFNGLSHMLIPVITDSTKAIAALAWAGTEARKRFRVISEIHTRDIVSYNQKAREIGSKTLPHIYMVIDDYSALKMTDEDTAMIETVLKEGRPVGIHLMLVTASTSARILKKDIRSNIPCRISFRVSSRADSRAAIDLNGAETLNIPGEILIRWQNTLTKCQASYTPYEEVKTILENHKLTISSSYNEEVLGAVEKMIFGASWSGYEEDAYDELLPSAIEMVVETGMASVSMLQRRLKLGYSQAARLVDQMEEKGVVGPFEGSKPRQVLISKEQWQEMQCKQGMEDLVSNASAVFSPVQEELDYEENDENSENFGISMRNYPLFYVGENSLAVSDNQLKLQIRTATKRGSCTMMPSFSGQSVEKLIYKRPGLFSTGYIQFKLKPTTDITERTLHLLDSLNKDLDNLLKIEFKGADAKKVRQYAEQISEDIGIFLTVL